MLSIKIVLFFDKLYTKKTSKNKIANFLYSTSRLIIRSVSNVIIPIYYSLTPFEKKTNSIQNVVVSLTTFPKRISKVHIVIESILRQSVNVKKVVLWLSRKEFENQNTLPVKLLKLQKKGLEIRLVEENFFSHKKYYYTFKEFSDSFIITVDDDIIYNENMVANLISGIKEKPNCIVTSYCKTMNWSNGKLNSYLKWKNCTIKGESKYKYFFGTGGGTLFPPSAIEKIIIHDDIFMKLSPKADDVWLNSIINLNNISIFYIGSVSNFLPLKIKNNIELYKNNNEGLQNDFYIESIIDFFYKKKGIKIFCEKRFGS